VRDSGSNSLKKTISSPIVLVTIVVIVFTVAVFAINYYQHKQHFESGVIPTTAKRTKILNQEEIEVNHSKVLLKKPQGEVKFLSIFVNGTGSGNDDRISQLIIKLSNFLLSNGAIFIQSLREDDPSLKITPQDRARNVIDIANYFGSLPEYHNIPLIVLGHSEGALVAIIACSELSSCKGIVCLSMPGLPGVEYASERAKLELKRMGMSDQVIDRYVRFLNQLYIISSSNADDQLVLAKISKLQIEFSESVNDKEFIQLLKVQQPLLISKWMRSFLRLDPAQYFSKLSCPVLLIYGKNDEFLDPELNSKTLLSAASQRPEGSINITILSSHDHFLMKGNYQMENGNAIQEKHGRVEKTILDWLSTKLRKSDS